MKGINGRAMVVCGGASGIGEATVRRLGSEGARVAVADSDAAAVEELARELRAESVDVTSFVYDQRDEESVRRLAERVTTWSTIDGLCLVAGIHPGHRGIDEIETEMFDDVHAVNLRGTLLVAKHLIPCLIDRGSGSIVVVGSVAGCRPVAGDIVYATSKAGLHAMSRSLSLELAPHGVRVNSILPGIVSTPLAARLAGGHDELESRSQLVPLRRLAKPAEIAAAIVFLLSDDAAYITGTDLLVDGGLAAMGPTA